MSFKKFPFKDKPDTACITCVHIVDENKPVLYASHDSDDGCWQFLCGNAHDVEDSRVVSLREIYKLDNSIKNIANLEYGKKAYRKNADSKWIVD